MNTLESLNISVVQCYFIARHNQFPTVDSIVQLPSIVSLQPYDENVRVYLLFEDQKEVNGTARGYWNSCEEEGLALLCRPLEGPLVEGLVSTNNEYGVVSMVQTWQNLS